MSAWTAAEGSPNPLGCSWLEEEQAYNFALFSEHAETVTLLLFRPDDLVVPDSVYEFDYLRNKSGRIWHCRVPAAQAGEAVYYAYRVTGPATVPGGPVHAFDPQKTLLDPYARSVYFPPEFDREAAMRPGSNAGRSALGLLRPNGRPLEHDQASPPRHESELIIYEVHVRGFTRHASSGLPPESRGTYAGLMEKIPYLKSLGVTAVELMPVFQFDPAEGNYWGYMPLNLFSPHNGYACDWGRCDQSHEFREMVAALHEADIEVILDVVYNHTAEGDQRGPTYSYKGIDNSSYYITTSNPGQPYANFSGTGNTLNCSGRHVRRMILDSLRYWVREMRVDGFRFDLASIFARDADGRLSTTDPPLFGEIRSDPELAGIRLIAEPWDAEGAMQLGRSFPGSQWLQWNGFYRDDLRRFVRGDQAMIGSLMRRLYGSDDLFPDDRANACHPWQSVNYLTSHDGFTLYDMVSYNERHNQANGHNNTDGHRDNLSWNCGWEGDVDVPAEIVELRHRQVRNFVALLFLSAGTPMFRAGDEFLQTQGGNNNPYNQDNEISWLDWRRLEEHGDIHRFFQRMIAFRKAHPTLGRSRFWRSEVHWHGAQGAADLSAECRTLAVFLSGESQGDDDLYLLISAAEQETLFRIQEPGPWLRVVDTSRASPEDILEPGEEVPIPKTEYQVAPRSVVLLLRPHVDRRP